MASAEWSAETAPGMRFDEDWGWPGFDFEVPAEWPSGVYVVVLSTGSTRGAELPLDARSARLLVIVTPPSGSRSADILYKVPVFTYHAYNTSGGGSLYGSLRPEDIQEDVQAGTRVSRVSLLRPGGGVGGPVKGQPDPYDPRSPRQTFAHWDAKFLAWLEREGFAYDCCTDLDLHEGSVLPDGYRLLVSAGHDEYWSAEARGTVERFRDAGGNIANFGANTCWWRVTQSADGALLRCEKFPPGAPAGADPDSLRDAPDHWWESDPENALFGVSYRNGGGHWSGPRRPLGFRIQHADHWVFEGMSLREGDVLGEHDALIGYECDGAAYVLDDAGHAQASGSDGTPPGFRILGFAPLPREEAEGWQFAAREPTASPQAATLGLHRMGGTVFTAATTDWARLLATDAQVQAITRNVLSRLSSRR
ncbi:N,N-dimethylformamidase beta subunit family domain-containing protein [Streptomyces axinellae]